MHPMDMMICDYNCEFLGLSRLCLMESAGKSLAEEVGKILNINPVTIRQIERDAFRILRKFFNSYDEKDKEKQI